MNYKFNLEKVIETIKKQKAKRVLLQFPEGLKPKAIEIAKKIESKTKAKVLIWMDSCYGACDLPQGIEKLKIDLVIQFGHSAKPFWPSKLEIKTNN